MDFKDTYNCIVISDSETEMKPMNISKEGRILTSESEDGLQRNKTISKNLTKRSRSLEQSVSSSDEDVSGYNKQNDAIYIQKIRKAKRNSGKKYCTQRGKIIPEKLFENKNCHCVKGCINLISVDERKQNFDKFWSLADFSMQNLLLNGFTQKCVKKRLRPRNYRGTQRTCSVKYYLDATEGNILVCKRFFLETFNISKGRVDRALNSKNFGEDFRGRMEGSSRKTAEKEVNGVKEHVQTFSQFESHYTNRKYLSSELNIRKMYNLYVVKCNENNTTYVKEKIYRNIFNKEFNLSFYNPRKDTC